MSEKNNQIIESIYYYYKHNSLEKIKALLADYFAQQKIAYYIYVPEAYYQDLAINRYTKETAPENHLFGSVTKDAQHFTQLSYDNSPQKGTIADAAIIRMMNPNKGLAVDFQLAWDRPHMGDYDLDELFNWLDSICK